MDAMHSGPIRPLSAASRCCRSLPTTPWKMFGSSRHKPWCSAFAPQQFRNPHNAHGLIFAGFETRCNAPKPGPEMTPQNCNDEQLFCTVFTCAILQGKSNLCVMVEVDCQRCSGIFWGRFPPSKHHVHGGLSEGNVW